MPEEQYWYKQAVFYELNVRGFYDSNGDGIGDLAGIAAKLDYLKSLGVDVLWLLPITRSPMRDGGYDVSDMMDIHPDFGTLADFRALVSAVHARGMKLMVELIPNHTSDQHPWFIASRDPGHPEHERYRDFYVWSETDRKYRDARIIFLDTERSNWSYDPLRQAFYWHRFFSHQPDLNYDNPEVQRAMLRVIQFWIDQGADAIRVDAPPYLFEREGTSCENLPESHAYYRRLRAFVDAYAPGTLLLAEANQWPEDTREYFGAGDEFQMNFHFPLMPRLYLALAQRDRTPVVEILKRTPPLPENCQWGSFLRCHDELTLEMVTPEERTFLWDHYAPEPRMRLNLGIRRRLAPLLENDPARIRLLHILLLSLVGSPVLYYGDEIGMGDNIWLEDRDGVRTPMQWDDSANGGFSTAPAGSLYLPVIEGPVYGTRSVNAVRSDSDPGSLLNWLRGMIALRRRHPAFGAGGLKILDTRERRSLAYLRETAQERLLVLVNLSPDALHLDWAELGQAPASLEDLEGPSRVRTEPDGGVDLEGYGYRWYRIC